MEEKKKVSNKKTKTTSSRKNETKKTPAKKTASKKVAAKKQEKKVVSKKEEKITKEETVLETKVSKEKKEVKKKKCGLVVWFNKLTLEQIVIAGVIIISILLFVLIGVSTKNTKTKNGDDIVAKINGKTITADDLYKKLKESNGRNVAINMIDEYILDKEYKTTDDMKKSVDSTIQNYKNTYGDNYNAFLEYNGINSDSELKDLLLKNTKLTKAVEEYIKDNLTDKEMKKYYEEKIVGDISARHILISFDYDDDASEEEIKTAKENAKKEAESLIERIKNGEDFITLAKENSDDEGSKEDGGNLGYFNTGDMVKEFEEAAYALNVNEYTTKPVESTYGYHIIMKTGEKEKVSYKKAKDTIIEKLIEEKQNNDSAINEKALIYLREKYNLKIKDKSIKKDYNDYIKQATTTTTAANN